MKKYLFLNAEDRRPAEESDYRYKKSKPVTAMKAKRDEEGFFIPWAMFRPIGEKGLLCELFGANPLRRAADLRMNRASELWMQQEFCKEEQAMELYQKSKIQNMPKLTPDGKRKVLLDALTWKYDCVQQYKKICFQFAEAVIASEKSQNLGNAKREHFIEQFIKKANELPEANRRLLDLLYETAWHTIYVFKYGTAPEMVPAPWYDRMGGVEK